MHHPSNVALAPAPKSLEDLAHAPEQHSQCHSEHLDNDLDQQIKNRQYMYVPRDWVHSRLDQVKAHSTLHTHASVRSDAITVNQNILAMKINTHSHHEAHMELHFFQDGIVKFNCVNPCKPSKFSFELVEKPANLTPYALEGKVNIQQDSVEVQMPEVKVKVVVHLHPFKVTFWSVANSTEEMMFEVNGKKCLKFDEHITADFTFNTDALYGLAERATSLILEDTKTDVPYNFYNQDLPCYPIGCKGALYGTMPIIVSRNKKSSSMVSMYWQNTSDTYIDVHKNSPTNTDAFWFSEKGNLECYVFVSHDNATHFRSMSHVFGHCAMPQYFSLGYHQCRWSYENQVDVLGVNDNFNTHEIPCDSITLDIDHTDGCRYFTHNETDYPDFIGMQATLAADGRQLITIADPHIKVDDQYHVYQEAVAKDLCVKNKDNETFIGACWPGASVYLDFLNEETRLNWASQYGFDKYKASTKNVWAWNDMNEPSVFEQPGNHMPMDNLQTFKSVENPENTFQVEHGEVHNIYGYCQHKATYDGMLKRDVNQNTRPHVLSRSFYAGSQKWTTIWTGDTDATWEYLKITVPQMLSLSLCGLSNVGGDVGGFAGNPEPELAVRWYQLGTYMPYFRGHSAIKTKRREPWCFDRKHAEIIKESIKDRYKLLPYWYSAFEEHCRTAVPLLRPIWFDQEGTVEEKNFQEQDRFFVGDSLLVVPVLESGITTIKGALEGLTGRWYDLHTKREVFVGDEIKTGLERIGCFVKGGKIVPTYDIKSYTKSSKDAKESNIHLYVAVDEEDRASGKVYFDDGESFDYKKGSYTRKNISFEKDTLTWTSAEETEFDVHNRVTKVVLAGVSAKFENAFLIQGDSKKKITVTRNSNHTMLEFVTLASKNWKIVLE